MKIILAAISPQRSRAKNSELDHLLADYVERIARYYPCEPRFFASEQDLFDFAQKNSTRTPIHILLLDSLGKQFTSEAFAAHLGKLRDTGAQQILFAIGPANGWAPESRKAHPHSRSQISLGPMTLPHELARVVLAEQIYRACTILAGHPYHSGH